ncbi:MAG: TIGR00282 family metallophosphoesterase [Clostridia bacterium]|nr:TIGR00282 family metallophosphoesterase [Clostridia bacterium]
MKVLCIGDVVAGVGCRFLRERLPALKKSMGIDIVICNGENSADGNGVLPTSADFLFQSGVDVITLGNHAFRRREIYPYLEDNEYIIRPANYPASTTPGRGVCVLDCGRYSLAVINLIGNVFNSNPLDCPFYTVDKILKEIEADIIIVDIHAEATSEKRSLGFYLDGRVSAVFGTHTHVRTADCQILPKGTGYITDAGMTGPKDSVLGVKPEITVESFRDKLPIRFEPLQGDCMMDCVMFEIDEKTGKTLHAESLSVQ